MELFLIFVQNLAGRDELLEPLKKLISIFVCSLIGWGFFIPTTMGKQEFLDSSQKGIDFPSESGLQGIFSECTKNYPCS